MARVPAGFQIDPATGDLVPLTRRSTTKRRFMARISLVEYAALTAMRINTDVPLDVRAALWTLAELRDMADDVNLDDPDTQYGVAVATNTLTSLPEGTPGRIPIETASARVDAWLADYPQPGEAYP
ncbi:hypothetical protein [Gemmatimonas sp.]|jgi:hypothetical protein|uniref:hypothetical protein n=1 Tax=Gemmatimonas sp. TaxID=1962908 RepID=UPI0037C1799A